MVVLALVATALSGCIGTSETDLGTTGATGDDLVQAPEWRVGDWWTYHFTSDVYGKDFQATLVVGEVTGDGHYLVGMPADDFQDDVLLFHMPPTGRLDAGLAYDVHDLQFDPFDFPLVDGTTWTTQWATTPLVLTAERGTIETPGGKTDGYAISNGGQVEDAGRAVELTYAPSVGWFVTHERAYPDGRVLERIELVDHGRDHQGDVRVIDDIGIVLLEARSTVALGGDPVGTPVLTFDPDDRYTHLMLGCVVGGAPGHYTAEVQGPSGACTHNRQIDPGDSTFHTVAVEIANADGEWEARMVAGGQGLAVAEVLGYASWTVAIGTDA